MSAKKTGGGKLARTETVTVRLDPRLRYLAEIGARKQRRTVSSYIEWAIEESLKSVILEGGEDWERTLTSEAVTLWDVDEADRFVKLALKYPELLTHEEQVLWKLVRENGALWRGDFRPEWTWKVDERSIDYGKLREYWEKFVAASKGEADEDTLPTWKKIDHNYEKNPF